MTTFKIWEDGKKDEALTINATDMNEALDMAAREYGCVDYADLCQEKNWDSEKNDGLNIVEC